MREQDTFNRFNSSLLSLEDEIYFPLIRNYLTRIPTPFNKQSLNRAVAAFISRPVHIARLLSTLDERETELIQLALLVPSLREEGFLYLFREDMKYHELRSSLILLEQKLILIPDPQERGHLMLNPLLESHIRTYIDARFFCARDFSSVRFHVSGEAHLFFQALSSLALQGEKKKINLPFSWLPFASILEPVVLALRTSLTPGTMHYLTGLKGSTLTGYLLSLAGDALQGNGPGLAANMLEELEQLFSLIEVRGEKGLRRAVRTAQMASGFLEIDTGELLSLLRGLGWFTERNPQVISQRGGTIDSDHTITFHRGDERLRHSLCSTYALLTGFDRTVTYTLNRETLFRAYQLGLSSAEIFSDIELWAERIPQGLRQYIEYVFQEYSQVRIIEGIFIETDERMERIFDAHQELAPYIIRKVAKRAYLLSRDHEQKWREILLKAGIAHIAGEQNHTENQMIQIEETALVSMFSAVTHVEVQGNLYPDPGEFTEELLQALEKKKYPGEVKDLLKDRIQSHLILSEEQFTRDLGEARIIKASGFDYTRKVIVIRTALKDPTAQLEISYFTEDGSIEHTIGYPLSLTRKNGDEVLVLRILPEGEERHWRVRTLYELKSIPSSIFFRYKIDR